MARSLFIFITVALLLISRSYAGVPTAQPTWSELNPQQRQALAPLAGEWGAMENFRRKKWLVIADHYPTMKPEEQQRVQRNMKDWAALTPEERRVAREKYMALRRAPPEKREAVKQKWQEYDKLPDGEKLKLKQAARKRKITDPASKSRPLPLQPKPVTPISPASNTLAAPATP